MKFFILFRLTLSQICNDSVDEELCKDDFERELLACLATCDDEPICVAQCNRELADNIDKCPCQQGCPDGCPCPDYYCHEFVLIQVKRLIYASYEE